MKIDNIHQGKIKGLSGDRNIHEDDKVSRRGKSRIGKRPSNEVSRLSQLVSKARIASEGVSDIRHERIAEVQQRLADGFYDSKEVREELIARLAERLRTIMSR